MRSNAIKNNPETKNPTEVGLLASYVWIGYACKLNTNAMCWILSPSS